DRTRVWRPPTRGRTATTCISRCWPAAACSPLPRSPGCSGALPVASGRDCAWPSTTATPWQPASPPRRRRSRSMRPSIRSSASHRPTSCSRSRWGTPSPVRTVWRVGSMRIAFDGTALRPGRTGVGYYTEHLLHHLARTAVNDELIVVSNRAIDTTAPLPPRVRVATPARHVPRLVWMQTLASTTLRQVDADVVHFTNRMLPLLSPTPTVVTIHD